MTVTSAPAPSPLSVPRSGARPWLGLAVLILPTLVVAVDINAVFLAMPRLSLALHASATEQLWIADGYGFMVAGFVLAMGPIGDRVGRRRMLMIAGSLFAVLSVVAAYSTSPEMLIACRLLLGVVGASLMPSTLALITTMFTDARQRGLAITVWSSTMFGGAALGPILGGALLTAFWWGSVFLVATPVMAVMVLLAPATLPECRGGAVARPDPLSVALCLGTVLPVAWAVKQFAAPRPDVTWVVVAMAGGLGCGVALVRRQRRSVDPMLRLELLADRRVATILGTMIVAGAGLAALGWVTTQDLQSVAGLTPLAAAAAFAPMGLTMAVGCLCSPLLTRRLPAGRAIAVGLTISTLGFLPAVLGSGAVALVLTDSLVAFGTGPLFALGTGLVIGGVRPERAGSAAALAEVSNYLGSTVGITVFGTLTAAVYRSHLRSAPAPARVSVADADGVAHRLGGPTGLHLLSQSHAAFGSGVTIVAATGMAVFALTALLAHVLVADGGACWWRR